MRVIHILPSTSYSGAENVACKIIELFRNEIEMFYICPRGTIQKQLKERNIKFVQLEKFGKAEIQKVVDALHPDIVHAHDYRASYLCSKLRNISVISHLHSNPMWIKSFDKNSLAYAFAAVHIDRIVGVSQSILEDNIFKPLLKARFEVLQNFVDADYVLKKALEYKVVEDVDILFVGRLTEEKNPLRFIEIISFLVQQKLDVKAVMIGDGEQRQNCMTLIHQLNLEMNIKMKGFLDNPYPYMKKAHILIMPSTYEGFGLVAVEAMSLGIPVLCSGVGGLKDVVDQSCGAVCKSISDYSREAMDLLLNRNILETRSAKARESVKKFTNLSVYKNRLERIYRSVL